MGGLERGVGKVDRCCWGGERQRMLLRTRMMGWIVCDCVVTGMGRESRGLMHGRLGSLDIRTCVREGGWRTKRGHCGRRSFGDSIWAVRLLELVWTLGNPVWKFCISYWTGK